LLLLSNEYFKIRKIEFSILFFVYMNLVQFQWNDSDGKVISCEEKNEVLNENIEELMALMQNSYEDSILMGVSRESFMKNLRIVLEIFEKNLS
jgi:hypothetical protein